ncbi:PR domain zinc finger protein 10 [Helicoverpa armigera]|uniref:PR domain zinc finger protein 10 n=1 Tax=Helicoverpa armigera TaxID=29058 RepID=UPI0030834F9A
MNRADSQIPSAPTHLYLLQMDPSINLSSNEQGLPLHILDNSLDFGHKQYLLPLPNKQKEGQDLQVLVDSSQGPAKIMGVILDNKYQDTQNLLAGSTFQLQSSNIECNNLEHVTTNTGNSNLNTQTSLQVEDLNGSNTECKLNNTSAIKNFVHISDRVIPPRALAVLPPVLQLQRRHIISTRRSLPARARFGPVQGIRCKISYSEAVDLVLNATSNKKPLFLVKDKNDTDVITHIDTYDKDKSNWIGLLPLGDESSANVWLYEENYELYGITTEILPARKPLMLGYSKQYADSYGLIGPTKDIDKEPVMQKSWWCHECQHTFPSSKQLQNHTDLYHKEGSIISRRRYRCRQCSKTFSRIFSLRRHTALNCPVKSEKGNKAIQTEADIEVSQINVNDSICSEDNRIPSDESFQNYSNGLDFSTNLFDTDRIPNLDISGSRCDNDFNPYTLGYKDENGLTNYLDFSCKIENNSKEELSSPEKPALTSCPYCNQSIVTSKRRQHMSKCPARVFKCECKKVFTSRKLFTEHIWAQHSNANAEKNDTDSKNPAEDINTDSTADVKSQDPEPSKYKCEDCELSFKRRGMLVNHLWRVHNMVSAKVPLERSVRTYLCGNCPKIYRTAAKRDRHVQQHHPGAAKVRGQALESGTRVCEPAMCSACPRQYATRAKLLQHQRAQHPYMVPPSNRNSTKTK